MAKFLLFALAILCVVMFVYLNGVTPCVFIPLALLLYKAKWGFGLLARSAIRDMSSALRRSPIQVLK